MLKLLTLIIPTYNMERYLNRCLDSLLVENRNLLDVLIVNDGSKDQSSIIAHQYVNNYPETFRVVDKENGNYGSCINAALPLIKGKYIKVLDADDFFDRTALLQLLDKLATANADLILTDFIKVNEDLQPLERRKFALSTEVEYLFSDICKQEDILNLEMHSVAYNRNLFEEIEYHQSEGISYTDQEWIFYPMYKVKSVLYYNVPLYRYLIGREGQTMDPNVLLRSISHTIKGAYAMSDVYNRMVFCDNKIIYFQTKLTKRLKYIYMSYLISNPRLNVDEIISFDKFIKTNYSSVYALTRTIVLSRKVPIRFVAWWQKSNNDINSVVLKICRLLYRVNSNM